MTIRDLGYRRYQGRRTPTAQRWQVVMRHTASMIARQRWVRRLLLLALFPTLIAAVVLYLKTRMGNLVSVDHPAGGGMPHFVMSGGATDAAASLIYDFQVNWYGTPMGAFLVAMLAGGGIIADDIRTNAFQFYFARPLSKTQYLVGKLLGVFLLTFCVTAGPPLILVLVRASLTTDGADLARQVVLLVRTLILATLEAGVFSTLAVSLSSLTPRRGLAQSAFAGIFFLPWIAGTIFAKVMQSAWPMILAIPSQLVSVGAFIHRVEPALPPGGHVLPWPAAFLASLALVGGALALLRMRLDAVGGGDK